MSTTKPPTRAVLLVNLGTPATPTVQGIRAFLREFLADRRVVDVPRFLWYPILYLFILPFRPYKSIPMYSSIWIRPESGIVVNGKNEGSPLRLYLESLESKLRPIVEEKTKGDVVVRHAMRYGTNNISATLSALHDEFPSIRELVVLPLFPQYSSSTSGSVYDGVFQFYMNQWRRCLPGIRTIRDYAEHPAYIEAVASALQASVQKYFSTSEFGEDQWRAALANNLKRMTLLITYHSIPVHYASEGDDYPQRCQATTVGIQAYLEKSFGMSLEGTVAHVYQSQFGNQPWIGPMLSEAAAAMPLPLGDPRKDKFREAFRCSAVSDKQTQICFALAPGFAMDCVETTFEVEMEAGETFKSSGGTEFLYTHCLNDSDAHVKTILAALSL